MRSIDQATSRHDRTTRLECLAADAPAFAHCPVVAGFTGAEPLEDDRPEDTIRVLSQRQLNRLIFVAAESGARLGREDSSADPAAWMFAPRDLFGGTSAMEACRERDPFVRAMVLHRTGVALDLDPRELDELIDEEWGDLAARDEAGTDAVRSCGTRASLADFGLGEPALYTAAMVAERDQEHAHLFAAFLAIDEEDARSRLRVRVGGLAELASIQRGYDPSEPIAASLLSEPMSDILMDVNRDPASILAEGLDLFVEHRFAA